VGDFDLFSIAYRKTFCDNNWIVF